MESTWLEHVTACMQSKRSTKLSYDPFLFKGYAFGSEASFGAPYGALKRFAFRGKAFPLWDTKVPLVPPAGNLTTASACDRVPHSSRSHALAVVRFPAGGTSNKFRLLSKIKDFESQRDFGSFVSEGSYASEHGVFEYLTILLQRWYSDWYYHVDRAHPVIFPSRAKVRVRIRLKRRSRLTERGRLLWIHRPWIRVLFCCCFIFVE